MKFIILQLLGQVACSRKSPGWDFKIFEVTVFVGTFSDADFFVDFNRSVTRHKTGSAGISFEFMVWYAFSTVRPYIRCVPLQAYTNVFSFKHYVVRLLRINLNLFIVKTIWFKPGVHSANSDGQSSYAHAHVMSLSDNRTDTVEYNTILRPPEFRSNHEVPWCNDMYWIELREWQCIIVNCVTYM